jgi:hypothetical protein
MKKYGIAFTKDLNGSYDGGPNGIITGWRKDKEGKIELWSTLDEALEANDLGGWTGYVKEYPIIWKPCTRPIETFQCIGDDKDRNAGCGTMWLSVPWKNLPDNCWCPHCGNHSACPANFEFDLCEDSCVPES